MGRLHDALKDSGYAGHDLEVFLVRLLFCLFADDTGIFERQIFTELLIQRTSADGADLGQWLMLLFQVLNTPSDRRQRNLDEQLAEFPYVNGKLFNEHLSIPSFNAEMRQALLDATSLDWSRISPAIFGSMFQSVMDSKARRNLGAHYTSEQNILKVIGPLFLDALHEELERIGGHSQKLKAFHIKLAGLRILDPACGCGNFLVIAYRELRLLELEVLKRLYAVQESLLTKVADHVAVDVDQFYGIELEEFPAQIAQVALWLMDHQMNVRVGEQFGEYFARLPLVKSATITHGNALAIDWNRVVPSERISYILGNPPFLGKQMQSEAQRRQLASLFAGTKNAGVLDFVAGWYLHAARYIMGTTIRCAFVSTNSISQGEQVGVLWSELYRLGMRIHFAHRAFTWSNEARGKAAVHCVIIGFGTESVAPRRLFEYEHLKADPHEIAVSNINAYLVDAPDILLESRRDPICPVPEISFGSMPNDGGHLLLSNAERTDLLRIEPAAAPWIRPFVGSEEFIYRIPRWCLWLQAIAPAQLRSLRVVSERVAAVRATRLNSTRAATQALAATPALFGEIRQPVGPYIGIPKTSSEKRQWIPMGWFESNVVASTELFTISNADQSLFGVLQSTMHMAWVRSVCGRLKSDFRYSAGIVYNNFLWPDLRDEQVRGRIASAAQVIVDARATFPESTLADLYDPVSMPVNLVRAHHQLDRAVEAAYVAEEKAAGRKVPKLKTDSDRVAFLFDRYQAVAKLIKPATRKVSKPSNT